MISHTSIMMFLAHIILLLGIPTALVGAVPMTPVTKDLALSERASSGYWVANVKRQGVAAFNKNADYQVFRNVKDFGAKGKPCMVFIQIQMLMSN